MQFDILTIVAIILTLSFILSEISFRFNYPRVIGQLLAGIILGLPILHLVFTSEVRNNISFLADLGIIFLLLLIGMQLNLDKFKKSGKDSIIIALFCVLVPFILGFIFIKAIGYSTTIAFVVGSAFSLTAEGTKLKVLLEMGVLNTRIGIIMLGAGILDDFFEIIFLSILLIIVHKSYTSLVWLPLKLIAFVGMVYLFYKVFPLLLKIIQKEKSRIATFSFILLFALIIAVISKKFDLGPIIGAFIAGIIIHLSNHKKQEHKENIKELETMTFAFIIPFFFVNIGLNFDFSIFTHNAWLTIMILFIATIGKVLGALISTPFTSLSLKQSHLIGWGMNSRGAIELVIAEVARINNIIPIEIYSAIVFMAITTTLIFPIILKIIISKDREILY
ncbi:cation:proton antiporter [Candidatus Woesearchaeota archaeon]|nr:cation:proton antiporter [Candidatus Woesearchaeota archaeon]